MPKYPRVEDGELIRPVQRNYKMACCDCGLVHRIDFIVKRWGLHGHKVFLRAWRDTRATAAMRRGKVKRA